MKLKTLGLPAGARETACLQARCGPGPSLTFCLPCRRSRVRIPSAALRKGLQNGVLSGALSSPERLSRRGFTEDRPSPAATPDLKPSGFAGEFGSSRTVDILQAPQNVLVLTVGRVKDAISSCPLCSSPRARRAMARTWAVVRSEVCGREMRDARFHRAAALRARWMVLPVLVHRGSLRVDHRHARLRGDPVVLERRQRVSTTAVVSDVP
jgi:ribosomal protein L37AE/L43A